MLWKNRTLMSAHNDVGVNGAALTERHALLSSMFARPQFVCNTSRRVLIEANKLNQTVRNSQDAANEFSSVRLILVAAM